MARLNWENANERNRVNRDLSRGCAITVEPKRAEADAGPWCPSCNAYMTRRVGARGPFWGCSRFPFCRGLVPIR